MDITVIIILPLICLFVFGNIFIIITYSLANWFNRHRDQVNAEVDTPAFISTPVEPVIPEGPVVIIVSPTGHIENIGVAIPPTIIQIHK